MHLLNCFYVASIPSSYWCYFFRTRSLSLLLHVIFARHRPDHRLYAPRIKSIDIETRTARLRNTHKHVERIVGFLLLARLCGCIFHLLINFVSVCLFFLFYFHHFFYHNRFYPLACVVCVCVSPSFSFFSHFLSLLLPACTVRVFCVLCRSLLFCFSVSCFLFLDL